MVVTFLGISILLNLVQYSNALSSMQQRLSGNIMSTRLYLSAKALSPIISTPWGIVNFESLPKYEIIFFLSLVYKAKSDKTNWQEWQQILFIELS